MQQWINSTGMYVYECALGQNMLLKSETTNLIVDTNYHTIILWNNTSLVYTLCWQNFALNYIPREGCVCIIQSVSSLFIHTLKCIWCALCTGWVRLNKSTHVYSGRSCMGRFVWFEWTYRKILWQVPWGPYTYLTVHISAVVLKKNLTSCLVLQLQLSCSDFANHTLESLVPRTCVWAACKCGHGQ